MTTKQTKTDHLPSTDIEDLVSSGLRFFLAKAAFDSDFEDSGPSAPWKSSRLLTTSRETEAKFRKNLDEYIENRVLEILVKHHVVVKGEDG